MNRKKFLENPSALHRVVAKFESIKKKEELLRIYQKRKDLKASGTVEIDRTLLQIWMYSSYEQAERMRDFVRGFCESAYIIKAELPFIGELKQYR